MASELSWRHQATGNTLYATIRSAARTMWNGSALETLTVANWGNYDIALTETPASSYFHVGTWPAALTTTGWYWVDFYLQAGGSPAISDTLLGTLIVYWNGTTANPWDTNTVSIGSEACRDVSQSITGRNVWHVAKTGNDSNDGKSYDTAKLTVAGAVAVCAAGEIISIGPGTFSEAVDVSSLDNIGIIGSGWGTALSWEGTALTIGEGCRVRDLQIIASGSSARAISAINSANIVLDNLYVQSEGKGIRLHGGGFYRINNSIVKAGEYGIEISLATFGDLSPSFIEGCSIYMDGWSSCNSIAVDLSGGSHKIRNSMIHAYKSGSGNESIGIEGGYNTLVENCLIEAVADGETVTAKGVRAYSYLDEKLLINTTVRTSGSGTLYDLHQSEDAKLAVHSTNYDVGKTFGTITDLDERSVTNVWDDAIPGSPTAGSRDARLKAVDDDLADGGRLDVILDATKTAAEAVSVLIVSGAFTAASLANAPTGTSLSIVLQRTALSAAAELPVEVDQNYSWSKDIPTETLQDGKNHKFSVYNIDDRSVALWSVDNDGCTVSDDGYTVTVAQDDTNTGTSGTFYYELANTTDDELVCSGPFAILPRGDTE